VVLLVLVVVLVVLLLLVLVLLLVVLLVVMLLLLLLADWECEKPSEMPLERKQEPLDVQPKLLFFLVLWPKFGLQ
jgi:hypothetical protein